MDSPIPQSRMFENALDFCIFNSLPSELNYRIFVNCTLKDILSLRQCSKSMLALTLARPVWFDALSNLSEDMRIPIEEFGPEALNSQQLELLALSHLRFRYSAKQLSQSSEEDEPPFVPPFRTLTLTEAHAEKVTCVRMTRGGRFLLVLAMLDLQIWDLGTCGSTAIPTFLAQETIEPPGPIPDRSETVIQRSRWVGETLQFDLLDQNQENLLSTWCFTYEVQDLHTANPRFVVLSRYIAPQTSRIFRGSVDLRLLGWNEGNQEWMAVHHIPTATTVQWSTEGKRLTDLEIHESHWDCVLSTTIQLDTLHVFTLPEFPSDRGSSRIIKHEPTFSSSWKDEIGGDDQRTAVQTSAWLFSASSVDSTAAYDVIVHRPSSGVVDVYHKALRPLNWRNPPPSDQLQDALVSVHHGTYENLTLSEQDVPYSITYPDGVRVLIWEDAHGMPIVKFHMSELRQGGDSFAGVLYSDEGEEDLLWGRYSLSGFMGRFCFLRGQDIRVLDLGVDPSVFESLGGATHHRES